MSKEEMLHLFDFGGDDENADVTEPADISVVTSDYERANETGCSRNSLVSTDDIMDRLLRRHHPR